jgi:hypothetical protein
MMEVTSAQVSDAGLGAIRPAAQNATPPDQIGQGVK